MLKKALGTLLLLAGLFIFLAPDLYMMFTYVNAQAEIYDFCRRYGVSGIRGNESGQSRDNQIREESKTYCEDMTENAVDNQIQPEGLREKMEIYNKTIFREHQEHLCDAWSYEQNPFPVEMPDALFGYIEIPSIDVILPLYLGAAEENMARGAAILGQSSLPVGGSDTNSVIAGHRGYRGAPYFREIEKLRPGDVVRVTSPCETLSYIVEDMAVIDPSDINAILIRPGKEMITLVTCHPYMGHGKYRYVVYCTRREEEQRAVSTGSADSQETQKERSDKREQSEQRGQSEQQEQYERKSKGSEDCQGILSSAQLIFFEQILRRAGAVVILIMLVSAGGKRKGFH